MKLSRIKNIIKESIQILKEQVATQSPAWWNTSDHTTNNNVFNSLGANVTGVNFPIAMGDASDPLYQNCPSYHFGGMREGGPISFSQSDVFAGGLSNAPSDLPVFCVYFIDNDFNCQVEGISVQSNGGIENLPNIIVDNNLTPQNPVVVAGNSQVLSVDGCFSHYASLGNATVEEVLEFLSNWGSGALGSNYSQAANQAFGGNFETIGGVNMQILQNPLEDDEPSCDNIEEHAISLGFQGGDPAVGGGTYTAADEFCIKCQSYWIDEMCECCDSDYNYDPDDNTITVTSSTDNIKFCCDMNAENYGFNAAGVSINNTVTWPGPGPGTGGDYVDTYLMLVGPEGASCDNTICQGSVIAQPSRDPNIEPQSTVTPKEKERLQRLAKITTTKK
jgi:hypothetical protein